ncbi:MAG: ATP-dependent zinc metalloprotease FtsH [Actinomycetota bacterium]|nr:ATP-dependent zinc metalloprotease FtsH [Actinomycetota bacterium]
MADTRSESATKSKGRESVAAKVAGRRERTGGERGWHLLLGWSGPALLVKALVVLLAAYAGALFWLSPSSPGEALSLSQLSREAVCAAQPSGAAAPPGAVAGSCAGVADRILSARLLDQDSRIVGTVAPKAGGGAPRQFWTAYPRSDAATAQLLSQLVGSGARVSVDPQSVQGVVRFVAQYLLPLVVLAVLFTLLLALSSRDSSGASELLSFGRVGDKRHRPSSEQSRVTFADVAGADEAIAELAEVCDYLADPSRFAAMGALPPKGVLLMGPPGCGKTLLARAVAGQAEAEFFAISGSEFVESLVGIGAARVRDLFAQARAGAPSIIFIDELDAVARQRGAGVGQGHDEREQTLNEMLVQLDGFSPADGVVVMAATNRPDILDPALLRAGRFDRHVTVERPDRDGRLAILLLHARSKPWAEAETDLSHVAARTAGFTGADLASVVNESALLAVRDRSTTIDRDHLDEAVERVQSGPRRRVQIISDEEISRIAYHEAGHAVVAAAMGQASAVEKVSVVARGRGVGHLAVLGEDKVVLTQPDMEAQIAVAMAGIASEEMVFGHPSTGSEQDLERATGTARDMAGRFGMSRRLGRVRVLRDRGEVFLGRDYLAAGDASQPTLEHLDAEVRRVLDDQERAAREILEANRATLDTLAGALMSYETVQGGELAGILRAVAPRLSPAGARLA